MALHALNIYDRANAAIVVFKILPVQSLRDITLHSPALRGYILLSLTLKGFFCFSHDRCPLLLNL